MTLHLLIDERNERLIDMQRDYNDPKNRKQVDKWVRHRKDQIPGLVRVEVSGGDEPKIRIVRVEEE